MTRSVKRWGALIPVLCCFLLFLAFGREVNWGVRAGLSLCYLSIIPSVFPFTVFSSALASLPTPGKTSRAGRVFSRVFRLPPEAMLPFSVGIFCGFPLGAKATADGYRAGIFTREEAERLLCFTNNTSISFLLMGVGISMRGSVSDGLILFGVQTLVAVTVAFLLGIGKPVPPLTSRRPAPLDFSFPRAVADGVTATLTVSGFVVFFSALLAVLRKMLPGSLWILFASCLEVGSACSAAADLAGGLPLTAFCVCFSGISVMCQASAMLNGTDLSLRKYAITKLFSGFLGSALTFLILRLIP